MKRILTTALILAFSFGAVQAQNTANTPDRPHARKMNKMTDAGLNLTEDQKARLKSIRENHRKEMAELNKQNHITVAEMKKRREALQQKFRSESDAVLTATQKEQLAKSRTEWKDNRHEGRGIGRSDDRFGKGQLPQELNLTADQKQKVATIHQSYKPKLEALRNDGTLTQDQKRAKMQELRKEQQQEVKKVLTAGQNKKMENHRRQKAARNL